MENVKNLNHHDCVDDISDMDENAISINDTSAPQNLDKLLFQKYFYWINHYKLLM